MSKIKGKRSMTTLNMSQKMEFWDKELNIDFRHVDMPRFREGSFHSCPELLAPLTSNVIQCHNFFDWNPSQTWEEEEIHINVSRVSVVSNDIYQTVLIYILLSQLQITDTIGLFHVVEGTINCSHSCHSKSTYIPGICIIHGVMGNACAPLSLLLWY